jgi:cytochrome c-type biogenesis protein CcmE
VQLHGYVVPGSRMRKPDTLDWKFKVQNFPARSGEPGHVVDAYYTGIVPDTFKDEAEVVLKGQLGPNGFQVGKDGVVAKCPSKYEAAASQAGAGL